MVAEDDGLEIQEIARQIRALGHSVEGIAETGRRVVELTRSLSPDLILLDIAMPGLDGISAAQEILAIQPVPIVMVTGHADPDLMQRAAAAGIFTYLLKPVSQPALDAAIRMARARFEELQAVRQDVRNLTEALELRKVVEQAKGILMKRLQVSEAEAFRLLQRRASAKRRSIREVADAVREADGFYREIEADGA